MRKIRVLVVDDSLLFREAVSRGISEDASIEVVGKAGDAFEARDKIIELEPDVLTLDVEMPKMSGIEFLKKLLPQYPVPVIVVSSANNNVFEALNAGAVDFVAKPSSRSPEALSRFISELVLKIKIGSTARVGRKAAKPVTEAGGADNEKLAKSRIGVIAIGASTGAPKPYSKWSATFRRVRPVWSSFSTCLRYLRACTPSA